MHLARKLFILGAILAALLLPGLAVAAQPANTYTVILQNGAAGTWSPAPTEGEKYYVPNGQSQAFTFTAIQPGTGSNYVTGMIADNPASAQGYVYYANTPNTTSQTHTVNYVSTKPVRVLNPGVLNSAQVRPQYPDKTQYPIPMWGSAANEFRYQDPISGAAFHDDGTNSSNPATPAGTLALGGVTYLLQKLQDSATQAITFKGQQHVVYSAVPQDLTIDYAYKNAAQLYDPKSLFDHDGITPLIDFTLPGTGTPHPGTINGGQPTSVSGSVSLSTNTNETVYTTMLPTDANSLYFIPNLPNTPGQHNGLTTNIYFVSDPFMGKSGYWPNESAVNLSGQTVSVNATAKTFSRSTGNWITDGIQLGDTIITSGFTNPTNNAAFVVSGVTPLVITCKDAKDLVNVTNYPGVGIRTARTVWPNGVFHLTPYGWALDPRTVPQSYTLQLLDKTGGQTLFAPLVLYESTPILKNVWKHTILGADKVSSDPVNHPSEKSYYTVTRELLPPFFSAIKAAPEYPFPAAAWHTGNYPAWFKDAGCYFHVQPMPGFQRNLLRYYTAWGGYQLWNQTSDLFVRKDGTIELPAVQVGSAWRPAPIVTQTWDGSQRYTVLNLTNGAIPSTYDDYPGAEYYLPGNVYLPGKAGVVTAYVDYKVQDLTGLTPRETDLWMGLRGDRVKDMLYWADAPVNNQATEPGGQANKPYMFGATTKKVGSPATWSYYCRLQSSNSFLIARLPHAALQGKLYDASYYVNLNDGQGYRLAAVMSYHWQPWSINASGIWKATTAVENDNLGAGVPQLTFADTLGGKVSIQASKPKASGWNASARTIKWDNPQDVDPGDLQAVANKLNGEPREYFATMSASDADVKFLIVLTAPQDITPAASLLLLD